MSLYDLSQKEFSAKVLKLYAFQTEQVIEALQTRDITFQEFVDVYKDTSGIRSLNSLLKNKELFEKLIDKNTITLSDVEYVLDAIVESARFYNFTSFYDEISQIGKNSVLLKFILSNFLMPRSLIDCFQEYLEQNKSLMSYEVFDIFDFMRLINFQHMHSKTFLELFEDNKNFYAWRFDSFAIELSERKKLIDIWKNDAIAQERLKEIIRNNIESTFENFEELMKYLSKRKKVILNI